MFVDRFFMFIGVCMGKRLCAEFVFIATHIPHDPFVSGLWAHVVQSVERHRSSDESEHSSLL